VSNSHDATQANAPDCTLLQELVARQAILQPDATALCWQGKMISYASLQRNIQAVASRLSKEGALQDRIAVLSWNCPEFVELIYGIPAAGQVLVPLNVRLAPAELSYQLQSSGATTLFGDRELLQPLLAHTDFPSGIRIICLDDEYMAWREHSVTEQLPPTSPSDPVWILFTSGSTGRPKGAVLSHRSFTAGLRSAALARPVEPTDKYYYPFPLFHVAAHNVLLQHLYGATVVLDRAFDAAATLKACRELQVTTMSLAPSMISMLLDHPDFHPGDLRTVRTIGYGASAMPLTLLQRLLDDTDVGLCQSYGMTELSGSVAFLTVGDHQRAARDRPELLLSVGRPLPTARLRLIDEKGRECAAGEAGEILVNGAQCMERYWNDEVATSRTIVDGWLHTGDIGRLDDEGYLYIVDRKKDMIISGGENIASREIEEALRRHSSVKDCAVIGMPDPKWGETACAVLQLHEEVEDRELSQHCRTLLAGYKTPRRWVRTDTLPLNAAGKVDKPLLRQLYGTEI
jgi:acyl-CoA synthetase (AMP-forming)/AMP-acid ligase II